MAKKLEETYRQTYRQTDIQTDRLPLVVLSAAVAAKNCYIFLYKFILIEDNIYNYN